MNWDLAIAETGNGGDLVLQGNDLAVVTSIENMPYLGMFGGNVAAVTGGPVVEADSKDWWGNNLLMPSDSGIQFNSIVEKTLNTTSLTSAGRVIIENAIKEDLKFLAVVAKLSVSVTIVSTDRINVRLEIRMKTGGAQVVVISYKKSGDGDFWVLDFSNDFLV